jgi:uncharacterized repeat protein (TIGR03803 family)
MCSSRNINRITLASAIATLLFVTGSGAEAGKLRTLYAFPGGSGDAAPASLVRDAQGNLYGAASQGGTGVIFKLDRHRKETILYSFPASGASGNLAIDAEDNLYGTTTHGGDYGYGTVFKVSPAGRETTLHSFTGGSDSGLPWSGVTIDAEGNLYGATPNAFNFGTIFKINSRGTFSILHTFNGGHDGADPDSSPVCDDEGNLFGVASMRGAHSAGTIYELTNSGEFRVLHAFITAADGAYPWASLTRDGEGNLFGTALEGGSYDFGTAFELTNAGKFNVLHAFSGHSDGGYPQSSLVQDAVGNVYGVTSQGGEHNAGAVYRLSLHSRFATAYSFSGSDGSTPVGSIANDDVGNLYGTTYDGGQFNAGTVFRLKV